VSETIFFSKSPIKAITIRQIGRKGWPRNVAINVVIFGKVSKANARWTSDLTSMSLLNAVPSRTYSQLSIHAISGLPEYYVNQNDELTLPQPIIYGVAPTRRGYIKLVEQPVLDQLHKQD
jgi:hypothetical protein